MNTTTLVISAAGSVGMLLFLVMKVRMHAFVALILVSVAAGLFSGMPPEQIAKTMEKGMSGTLGFLAIVVGLGAMFGKILHETGALDQIALKLLGSFGEKRSPLALGIAGLVCALPLFFDVAIVLLIGVVFALVRRTGGGVAHYAVSLFAGVAAAAAFLLPGPTPMLLASQMGADFGWMILIGLCAAIPGMLLAGPVYGAWIGRRLKLELPAGSAVPEAILGKGDCRPPSFAFSMSLVLFPLLLVGLRSIGGNFVAKDGAVYPWLQLIGHPFIAILVACLLAFYGLAVRRGMSREKVLEICASALQPAGIILLVTGAGGVFKQVLVDSGVGGLLGDALIGLGLPIALAAFVISATVRVIQGSALVACLTTIGLILPIVETMHLSGAKLAALSVCIAGGSIVLSHVNDSGFWLFGKFTGATELQTLKTWTVMETILGTTGAAVGMLAFCIVP
jgi:Gnt-I system low-affinity gluconate transporter